MPTILIEGREAKPEERIRSAISIQKLAIENGWQAKIGYAQYKEDPREYKTGAKAGQSVEGKTVDHVWCQGFREGKVFTVVWENNKLDHCLYHFQLVTFKDLKEAIKC